MARIYRELPVNSIWEGAGNIQALDLLRALRKGPVADALMHEAAEARRSHAAVERLATSVAARLDDPPDEALARRLARDVALLVQAALLRRYSPEPVFEAFCAGRIDSASDAFGLLPAGADLDALIERALPAGAGVSG